MSDRNRFDKFTERARKVLSLAQEEAQRFQHNYIGTEHLLLGLVREGEGVAAKVLSNLGVELYEVRKTIEAILDHGDGIVLGEIGLTPRAKEVIELAVDEARRLNHHYIGTEHLLLGLIREGEGTAAKALESLGINLETVRTQTIQVLTVQRMPRRQREATASYDEQFDTFTVQAYRVLSLALEEVQRYQHHYVGTEHLLLAIIRERTGVAAQVLSNFEVEPDKVRSAIELIILPGEQIDRGVAGFTPRTHRAIQLAKDEAYRLRDHYIGIEHLLLGLIREGAGVAAGVLQDMGVTLEMARVHIMLVLAQKYSAGLPTEAQEPTTSQTEATNTEGTLAPEQEHDKEEDIPTVVPEREEAEEHQLPWPDANAIVQELSVSDQELFQAISGSATGGRRQMQRLQKTTVQTRRVLQFSREEALRFQHSYIGTEHLLLGLVREEEGVAAKVLSNLGVELNKVRSAVEFIIGRGDFPSSGSPMLTPRARKVLEFSEDEAHSLHQNDIGTEHLLLGLVREGEGIAVGILESLGVNLLKVREQVIKEMNNPSAE